MFCRTTFFLAFAVACLTAVADSIKFTPGLKRHLANSRSSSVDVILWLTTQPGGPISREVKATYASQIESLGEQIRTISRLGMPTLAMSPAEEKRWAPMTLGPNIKAARHEFAIELDHLRADMVCEIVNRSSLFVQGEQAQVIGYLNGLGGRYRSRTIAISTIAATVPVRSLERLAQHSGICWIDADGPGHPELNIQGPSLGLTTGFWANGVEGGVYDVGVLDTGVQQSHPAFSGHRWESNGGTTDSNGHGTGIAGIMASRDVTNRGMAWGSDTICVAIAGADAQSMSGMNYLVTGTTEKPENVNYSFGNGTATDSDYSSFDKFFDGVIDTYDIMVSKSTGNGGFGTTTITHPAPAYNLLASANMNDLSTLSRADDRIDSTSSRGPTLGGRKKPDITAPGTNSMTTNNANTFSNLGGTSSASPHTGGGIVLLIDLGVTDPMAAKAVLLNAADAMNDMGTSSTADDVFVNGSLWNKTYGWGYLDLGEAYLNGLDYFVGNMPAPSAGGHNYKLYKGSMFTNEKATLVWNRHVAYNGASYPTLVENLSNLELASYSSSTNALIDSSVSAIDNVEQVDCAADGSYVLKVHTSGTFDPDVANESFAIATEEGFSSATGPVLSVSLSYPANVPPNGTFNVMATVTNNGDVPAHNVQATFSGQVVDSGANPASLGTINAGASALANWTIRAPVIAGPANFSVSATSSSYGETFAGSANGTIMVASTTDVAPTSFTMIRGSVVSGGLADVLTSNNLFLTIRPGATLISTQYPSVIEFVGTSPSLAPASMTFSFEAAGTVANLDWQLELLHPTSGWTVIDTGSLSTTDTVVSRTPSGSGGYVNPATGEIRGRISAKATSAVLVYPWNVKYDRVWWTLAP